MTGSKNSPRRLGALAFAAAVLLSLAGMQLALAEQAVEGAGDVRTPLAEMYKAGRFNVLSDAQILEQLQAKGLFAGANGEALRAEAKVLIERYRGTGMAMAVSRDEMTPTVGLTSLENVRPVRVRPLRQMQSDSAGNTIESSGWAYNAETAARAGAYPLPLANEYTVYAYENFFVFRSGAAPPNRSRMMDIVTFAGSCPTPPAGITSIDLLWFLQVGAPTTPGFQLNMYFWEDFNPSAAPGVSVVSNLIGSLGLDYGPLPAGTFYEDILTLATPLYPANATDIGIQYDLTDNSTGALASGTVWFATGPPKVDPITFPGNPTGSSGNFFYRDSPVNGILTSEEASLFTTPPQPNPNFANFYVHVGGKARPFEVEPNNGPAPGGPVDAICDCTIGRTAAISPIGDVDLIKITMTVAGSIEAEVDCGANDTIMRILGSDGTTVEASNDDIGGGNLCSKVSAALSAGDHFIEVTDKLNDESYAYLLSVRPLATAVTGLKFSTSTTPAPKSNIVWDAQPSGSTYDINRIESIAALRASGGDFTSDINVICWDLGLANPTTVDISSPPVGDAYGYFSRAKNGCGGVGSWNEGGNQVDDRDDELAVNASSCP